jgi:hypothetical protein
VNALLFPVTDDDIYVCLRYRKHEMDKRGDTRPYIMDVMREYRTRAMAITLTVRMAIIRAQVMSKSK